MSDTAKLLFDMLKGMNEGYLQLEKAKTFNSLLAHEVMGQRSTEHFEYVDSHWTAQGVNVKYRCTLDGRTYTVAITASKP